MFENECRLASVSLSSIIPLFPSCSFLGTLDNTLRTLVVDDAPGVKKIICERKNTDTDLHDRSLDLISRVVHVERELCPDPAGVLDQTDPGAVSGHVQGVHNLRRRRRCGYSSDI